MGDNSGGWPSVLSRNLGASIAAAREAKGMSAVKLSEAAAALGVSVHRVAIPRIEKGEQVVTVPELVALGMALEADWAEWLITATATAGVGPSSRSERILLESALREVENEIGLTVSRIANARAALSVEIEIPDQVQEFREAQIDSYEALIGSLRMQQAALRAEIDLFDVQDRRRKAVDNA